MKTTFTPKFIKDNKECYSLLQVNKLSFIKQKTITLEDIIKSEIPFKDKIWFIWANCSFDWDKRIECYRQSKKIQEIFNKYGWVVDDFIYLSWTSVLGPGLPISEQKTILSEVLKYSKK